MAPEDQFTHDHATVGDVRLHYVTAGDEDDPLVVLLHGFPEFWYSWREQIAALAEAGFRPVAPDMRGYNRSDKPSGRGEYRMEKLVGDVTGLIDYFGREQARLVGHDWGGLVAWDTAIRHPEAIDQLAILNAPHPRRFWQGLQQYPDQWLRSWYMGLFQLPWLPEALLGARDCAGVEKMIDMTSGEDALSDDELQRYREATSRPDAITGPLNFYRRALWDIVFRELRSLVGESESLEIEAPTLLLWGEQDDYLNLNLSEGHEQWVSDLQVERIPDASHWVQNAESERVNEALIDFFEGT